MKKMLLLTAVAAVMALCSANWVAPHPTDCKKFILYVDLGEDGELGWACYVLDCPAGLCFIPETAVCDFEDKCKICNPPDYNTI
ncbi:MAG: hypothetical protein LBC19_06250 [Tannerella sp.]|jgi:hypothetical protein|nr:hypothetical protein [Tannerella sp.]